MRHSPFRKSAEKLLYISFLCIPLLVLIYMLINFHYLSNDGIQYIDLGYRLFHYGVFDSAYGVVPGWIQSPGFPVILGFCSMFLSEYVLGYIACFIFSVLILLFLLRFSKREINIPTAKVTFLLLIANPLFLRAILNTSTESFYTLIHFSIFIIIYSLIFHEKKLKTGTLLLLVLLGYILYQIRSEGILYVLIICGILVWGKKWKQTLMFILLISIISLPYGFWIKSQTGKFNIIPKITFNARVGDVIRLAEQKLKIPINNHNMSEETAWYLLDPGNNELYTTNILNDQYYYSQISSQLHSINSIKKFNSIFSTNIKEMFKTIVFSSVFPLVFAITVLIGLYYIIRLRIRLALLLMIWLTPSFYFMISHVEERFFYVLLPYLSLIAGYGIIEASRRIRFSSSAINIVLALMVFNSAYYYYAFYNEISQKETSYVVGQKIKKEIPQGRTICAKNYQITFFSGHQFLKMPLCHVEDLYQYLILHKAEYLLISNKDLEFRNSFNSVFNQEWDEYFKLQNTFAFENETVKLFEVI